MGTGLAEHFDIAAGDLVKTQYPVVAANTDEAFLLGYNPGEAGESVVFGGPVEVPIRLGPHIATNNVQLECSLTFYEQCAVKPGRLAVDVVVAVADIDPAGHAEGGVYNGDFMVHAAPEVEVAAFEQGPEPSEPDARGLPFVDDLL